MQNKFVCAEIQITHSLHYYTLPNMGQSLIEAEVPSIGNRVLLVENINDYKKQWLIMELE